MARFSAGLLFLLMVDSCAPESGEPTSSGIGNSIARIQNEVQSRLSNGGWKYDAYPELQSLDAGKTITVADLSGPGQINTIHITQMELLSKPEGEVNSTARSTILEIFFDGTEIPAVSVPLGDFFADASGRVANFSTSFVEKSPGSYNSYIPMPFRQSARVMLRNEADRDLSNYSYVEWERWPHWEEDLGYFHASWRLQSFQLNSETRLKVFRLDGPGHLVGQYWCVRTDEPLFGGLNYVMEANNQFRIDGQQEPELNYLGTECAFNFCWGWREIFSGHKVGINWVRHEAGDTGVSTYRFRDSDAVQFRKSLELTLDWTAEFKSWPGGRDFIDRIEQRNKEGGGWIDYSTTTYWYSADPAGQAGDLLSVAERLRPLLRKNPPLRPSEKQLP